jgi:hypothetical protein
MQIELIGCTSAGKSSLARSILQRNHPVGFDLVTSYDFVLRWARLGWIKNHRIRMLALNQVALLACLLTWRKNSAFYRFATGVILRFPPEIHLFERLKIARLVARNVGIHEIVSRFSSDRQVILADEGTLHIAHYLFVHVSAAPDMNDLAAFARLVDLPDVAVYLRQPEAVLIARTRVRTHKRIPRNASALVNRFIEHGLAVFERLAALASLEGRLLVVNGGERVEPAWDGPDSRVLELARKIVDPGIGALPREELQTSIEGVS